MTRRPLHLSQKHFEFHHDFFIEQFCIEMWAQVSFGDSTSNVKQAVKQGHILAPPLFSYLTAVLEHCNFSPEDGILLQSLRTCYGNLFDSGVPRPRQRLELSAPNELP